MSIPRVVTLTLHPAIDRVIRIGKLTPGGTFDGSEILRVPAGKGVNTARVLSALRVPARQIVAACWLGANEAKWFSDMLREQHGIQAAICPRQCATRFALTFLEADGRETHIKEAMPAPSLREEAALLAFWRRLLRPGDIVAVCGSAPQGTSAAVLRAIFSIARERCRSVVLADTNGALLNAAAKSGLDLLKGNAAEFGAWLKLGDALDLNDSSQRECLLAALRRPGAPRALLMTAGASGATFIGAPHIRHAPPPKLPARLKIVSATGCGDAATAGVLWSILRGATEFSQLLTPALACGTAKLTCADPGELNPKLVRTLMRGK